MRLDPNRLRVYVVTAAGPAGRSHADLAEAAIAGGASAIQLRAPELDDASLAPIASALAARCRAAGVLLIVNDRVAVARATGDAGAHVGLTDDPAAARMRLGEGRALGMSVRDAAEARAAVAMGADYLGVTVWATPSKPEAEPRGLGGVREVAAAVGVPVVGIGGIDAGNARAVIEAGAAGVAVISAVAGATDPVAAVRAIRAAVEAGSEGMASHG